MERDILVIDENKVDLSLYAEALSKNEYSVDMCFDLKDSLTKLEANSYKLVLLPLSIIVHPDMKFLLVNQDVIKIVLADYDQIGEAIQLLKLGVHSYLRKPLNIEELVVSVKSVLRKRALDSRRFVAFENIIHNLSKFSDYGPFTWTILNEIKEVISLEKAIFWTLADSGKTEPHGKPPIEFMGFNVSQKSTLRPIFEKFQIKIFQETEIRILTPSDGEPLKELIEGGCPRTLVPIFREDQLVAVMFFEFESGISFDKELFENLQDQISLLFTAFDQVHQAKRLAFIDELTGLYNMRYLDFALDQEIRRAERYRYPVSVLFLDLDHFKSVNDTHGHLVGSQLLIKVARLLEKCLRDVDTIIRYGGDEYVCILPQTSESAAKKVAERIQSHFENTSFQMDDVAVQLTSCIGISSYPKHARSKKDILSYADKAMYQGKDKKNSIFVASYF